ncbi:MAG TPA: hypothetical protein VMJ34_04240 [Bryobacteraceae bacterium]|nr:hypothetical protein [Bryobacteraceae bacterium]
MLALPISTVAIGTAAHTIGQLSDPCVAWGAGDSGSGSISPGDPCQQRSAEGETRTEAWLRIAGIHGVILVAAILAVCGAAFFRPKMILLAGALMILESPLTFTLAPLALLTGAGFVILGLRQHGKSTALSPVRI